MADHLIRATLTYAVIDCGNGRCGHTWERAHTDLASPGWTVCPRCWYAAPTNVEARAHPASPLGGSCGKPAAPPSDPLRQGDGAVRTSAAGGRGGTHHPPAAHPTLEETP
jgi:hypothetical protein